MASVDKFIILRHVQFSKNGYQNRYQVSDGRWVTKSVTRETLSIINKRYADGNGLFELNMEWIDVIRHTLNIKTEIMFDYPTMLTKTERLIDLIKYYGGDIYVTNPDAKNKYLDEDLMRRSGIEIEYIETPKHLRKHTFEIFSEYGIDGVIRQLAKRNICQLQNTL